MTMPIPGSERFSSRPVDPDDARRARCPRRLPGAHRHPGADRRARPADLRGRSATGSGRSPTRWARRSSACPARRSSPTPTTSTSRSRDELGQEVQVGLYNTMLVGAVDLAIYWTLQHRASNPGIAEGDMFLCNDPWVGGGLHQNDAMVFQPVFHEGKLFAWTSGDRAPARPRRRRARLVLPGRAGRLLRVAAHPADQGRARRPAAGRRRRHVGAPLPGADAGRARPAREGRRQHRRP